jgi:ABC-type transport system involved in cytochrome c biogenesis permease subunit
MMKKTMLINAGLVALLLFWFGRGFMAPKQADDAADVERWSRLPVMYEGRLQPMDTLARNTLTILSGKQSLRVNGKRMRASAWLLDNVAGVPVAVDYEVFRVDNIDLLSTMGLEERKGFRYSYRELSPGMRRLEAAAQSAWSKPKEQRDAFDRQAIKVLDKIYMFQQVVGSFEDPTDIPADQLMATAQRYAEMENYSIPRMIPPHGERKTWSAVMSALLQQHPAMAGHQREAEPYSVEVGLMMTAYRRGEISLFNDHLSRYERLLEPNALILREVVYNRASVFMKASVLYLVVFVVSCFGWMLRRQGALTSASLLMGTAFVFHTWALIERMFLSGYPPVTNLYSTAIFIGWGAVLTGLVLEGVMRRRAGGMGNLVGSIAGFATLLIAHYLAGEGDTLEKMRAVLDTRFWLTTHVITITLGYMGTFVAGTIGLFFIVSGLFSRRIDRETSEAMYRMMYGVTCFGLLLSFVGTVLGGLWADDSWGRFWGWDPKENGALMIVIWSAVILHARYGRMIAVRGFAVMCVFGNIVTAWSWFGVNQLGVGLHSYGFTDKATSSLVLFVLSQLLVCGIGLLPRRFWRSGFSPQQLIEG